ncbi:MAG: hypothetical protein CUN56_03825 [Phototrophicales bacterium]|nr:MAG: hypothetical protein CUN56_03825 [Phototrophicales bacterium]RMG76960.1 MAG: hypothetical protein D6711_02775 [Chloroflexota bacterium]
MVDIPRIVTVDPTGNVSRIVRAAMDLLDISIIQVDIPDKEMALEEVPRADLVVSAFDLGSGEKGFIFALEVKRAAPQASVIILGDVDDPDELDEETQLDSPFVYLSRPIDIHQFLRVLVAGLSGHEAMLEAMNTPMMNTATSMTTMDMGPVPTLDTDAARRIIEGLQADLGAMAILLVTRTGETLIEVGASGLIDRDSLARALAPVMSTNISVKELVGGQVSTVQLYDGDEYDVFVLSIGLHHLIGIVFDGQQGSRQFGLVNRFGRRTVEDLIGLIGANAFFIQPPAPKKELQPKPHTKPKAIEPDEPIELERAEIVISEDEEAREPIIQKLETISDDEFDPDALFESDFDLDADSLFDLDEMEELVKQSSSNRKGLISMDDAEDLGFFKRG